MDPTLWTKNQITKYKVRSRNGSIENQNMDRRNFIKIGALGTLLSGTGIESALGYHKSRLDDELPDDIAVVGGTPAGIMAAIAAARLGSRVKIIEYHGHLGGMSTSGLGKSDIEKKEAIAGLFKEFTQNVYNYYVEKYGVGSENVALCKEGYYYEPSVAEFIFNEMLQNEPNISVWLNYQIEKAEMDSDRIVGAVFKHRLQGDYITLKAKVFVDATYEGDLFALAGAAYRLGREGKSEFGEEHAGKIFFDFDEKTILQGSTGEGDKRLPAYTYRLCMTDDPANSYILTEPPHKYDRANYIKYFEDLQEGRLSAPKVYKEGHGYYSDHFDTMVRVFSFTEIPNNKYDVNINPRPLGFPFVGENYNYPESDWEDREKIFRRHRALTLGLIYFVQNDPEISEEHRKIACQYHLPLDEFTDNQHFPWQLYIREARRLKGLYTLTENDVTIQGKAQRTTVFHDSIITGEFPIDSFPVSKEPAANKKVLEGYIGLLDISPYQIPYRILVPEKVKGLIVPVAASTTHVAFSTVRMEPLWMGIGQVAGIAANLAHGRQVEIRDVPIIQLQQNLIKNRQILTYFEDLDRTDKAFDAVQFWGTKGFFDTYFAGTKEEIAPSVLSSWLEIFHELTDLPPFNSNVTRMEGKSVRISSFSETLNRLGKDLKFKASGEKSQSLNKSGMDPSIWLYSPRNYNSPLLRGEACVALYNLIPYRMIQVKAPQ